MEIVEYSKTETALATLRERYRGVVYDVSKREGMTAAKDARAESIKEFRGITAAIEDFLRETTLVVFIAVCVFVAGINPFTY